MFTFRQIASFPKVEALSTSSVWRYMKSITPSSPPPEGMVYTDGSKIGQPPSAGALAVTPNGTVYVCRAPGI